MFSLQAIPAILNRKHWWILIVVSPLFACAVSPETQAKMDEFARTIPSCTSATECQAKWNMANAWVVANSDFGIRSASDSRIVSTTNRASDSGIGIIVERVPEANGRFQILVEMECLSAYGCPELWDNMLDFNRSVNAAN